jgi:predicted TPR repeat methyltransferase
MEAAMDMSKFDPREVARYQASDLGDHASLMRFALHVEALDPANLWPQMIYARSAACDEERAYYLDLAVRAGRQRLETESMDAKESRLFRMAHYALAHVSAKLGNMEGAARVLGSLLEIDPADEMNALGMGATMGVFPVQAVEVAARMRM